MNSRYFNLKKNTSLQENLLLGNITPAHFATMSYQELASQEVSYKRNPKLLSEQRVPIFWPDLHYCIIFVPSD
jgi:hypothetical protein